MSLSYDAIVIGGGSGGVAFARHAAELGASICLIEKDRLGGTCVNRGCVPKKLMWHGAWTHQQALAACTHGLGPAPPPPDFAALKRNIGAKLDTLRASYGARLSEAGVTVRCGAASVTGPDTVEIGEETLRTDHLVLATGATPQTPPLDGDAAPLTSDNVFGWTTLPASLGLIGGGYIGCEFASVFAGLGVPVTLIDTDDRLLSGFDAELADLVRDVLRERGVDLRLGVTPSALSQVGGATTIRFEDAEPVTVERVVAATGRAPCTDLPGGFTDALDLAETGAFAVDAGLMTSWPGVYAVGDCADRLPLTPVATRDGERLAQRLFGGQEPPLIDLRLVARSAFVMPPIAQIGQTHTAALTAGHDLIDGALSPADHWTTRTAHKIAQGKAGLAGVAAMGPGAPDIVASLGIGLSGSDLRAVTGIHPSSAEEFVGRG